MTGSTRTSTSRSNRSKRSRTTSSTASRGSQNIPKTEISISVYDLLPPGRLSSFLWSIGTALLHSGVVIHDREYAYGGHDRRGVTGVYSTKPRLEPPGGTFRASILHGFTFYSPAEISQILKDVAEAFSGPRYNLLTNNCNHFTSVLCLRLTGKTAPAWLNRAASIGVALPCVVPREWAAPPDHETAEGELLDAQEGREGVGESGQGRQNAEGEADERTGMLEEDRQHRHHEAREGLQQNRRDGTIERDAPTNRPGRSSTSSPGQALAPRLTDTGGRDIPVAERAPMPAR